MKRWIPLLSTLAALSPAWAQTPAASPVVVADERRSLELVLSKKETTLVREVRAVNLPAGTSRLRFFQVPSNSSNYHSASLMLSLSPTARIVGEQMFYVPPKGLGLENFVGERVSLIRIIGNTEKTVSGILVRSDPPILDTPEGLLYNPAGQWVLPRSAIESRPSGPIGTYWEWPVEASQAGRHEAEVLYATSKLTHSVEYRAKLNEARTRLQFQGWLQLNDDTGTDYPGAQITFRDAYGKQWPGPRQVDVVGRYNLRVPLASTDIAVSEQLSLYHAQWAQNLGDSYPSRSVTFQNTAENGLGKYLPSGYLFLWGYTDRTGWTMESRGENGFAAVEPNGEASISFGQEAGVTIQRNVSSRLLNPLTREWTVIWTINGQSYLRKQKVTVFDALPTNAKLRPGQTSVTQEKNNVRIEVEVPGKTEVKYVVETPA